MSNSYENLKTGWLAPDGSFFPCYSYDHAEEAREIVTKLGYSTIEYPHADDNLMAHGWCYIGISSFFCHEWRIGWNKFLTDLQKNFLKPYFESDLPVNDFAKMRWERENDGL